MRRRLTVVAVVLAALGAATTPTIVTFADPAGPSSTDIPYGITTGPDGAVWFTASWSDRIGRIDSTGDITTFGAANVDLPYDIVTGADGNLWFTSEASD